MWLGLLFGARDLTLRWVCQPSTVNACHGQCQCRNRSPEPLRLLGAYSCSSSTRTLLAIFCPSSEHCIPRSGLPPSRVPFAEVRHPRRVCSFPGPDLCVRLSRSAFAARCSSCFSPCLCDRLSPPAAVYRLPLVPPAKLQSLSLHGSWIHRPKVGRLPVPRACGQRGPGSGQATIHSVPRPLPFTIQCSDRCACRVVRWRS